MGFELHVTETVFNKVQSLLSAGESWDNIGVQVSRDPEVLRRYFRRFRSKEDLIYRQPSEFHGVVWNRPTQMWMVNLKGVFIGRYAEETEAAFVVDAIYADLFPRSSKWLPRNFARKKMHVYHQTVASIKNWKCKKSAVRRVTYFRVFEMFCIVYQLGNKEESFTFFRFLFQLFFFCGSSYCYISVFLF